MQLSKGRLRRLSVFRLAGFAVMLSLTVKAGAAIHQAKADPENADNAKNKIRDLTYGHSPKDFRQALRGLKTQFTENSSVTNSQDGSKPSARKLDAAREQDLALWLAFYAALDNVEAAMREIKMPLPVTTRPQPTPIMSADQQNAYENALLEDESARIHWTTLRELAEVRRDASSFFWMWAEGAFRNEGVALDRIKLQAQITGCLPARVAWLTEVLVADSGKMQPSDDGVADDPSVKREAPIGFPQYSDFKTADPDITHDVTVQVPTRMLLSRSYGWIVLRPDPNSFQAVALKIGKEMFTGIELDTITRRAGKPARTEMSELSGITASCENLGAQVKPPRKDESVSLLMTVFESPTPPQHMWMPSPYEKKYRVLWKKEFPASSLLEKKK